MSKVQIFENFLEEKDIEEAFEKAEQDDVHYYKSVFQNQFGEFSYYVIIYPTPVVEVVTKVVNLTGHKAMVKALETINEFNMRTKGIKYYIDKRNNVNVTYEFVGSDEEFDADKVLGTALAYFKAMEKDIAELIVILEKEKGKAQE
ncbi:YbjN domain-containing protein [Hathewaya massiliensis]|uniref:YbjN domain-containing protein n=1 Tax=Hathewaya massiliensis TaxID=1964382 RepID=UPI001156D692|nr:YbjN domain-containing protein [Hathewaya massiliensis]